MSAKRPLGPRSPKELAGPLLRAAGVGDVARVQELLAQGAKPEQRVTGQPTPLIAAAKRGHIDAVRTLLAGGADINFKHGGKTGTTALLEAIRHDQFETARELVEAGADASHDWSGRGHNIAFEAIEKCNALHREASAPTRPNLIYKGKGATSKAKAVRLFPWSVKLVAKILKSGGRPACPCLSDTAAVGNRPVLRLLLAYGTDVNEPDPYGDTAFSNAVALCRTEIAIELLKAGADPNRGEELTGPAFHAAVVSGNVKLVKAVVASGSDLNFRATITLDEPLEKTPPQQKERPRYVLNLGDDYVEQTKAYDSTPLITAVRAGHAKIVRILAKAGADLEAVDREGFTALGWALKRGRDDLAAILRRAGARETSIEPPLHMLFESCQSGDSEKTRLAIAAGANVNAVRESSWTMFTPLMAAARAGHAAVVDALLKAGANPDLAGREEGALIVGPLMLAARHGHVEVVRQLLAAGAGAEHPGRILLQIRARGDTAIHEAARNGHARVVEVLLQAGANPMEKSEWSGSVLAAAVESGNLETVKVVLAAGAKPDAKQLRELLTEARRSKYRDIVRELEAISNSTGLRS